MNEHKEILREYNRLFKFDGKFLENPILKINVSLINAQNAKFNTTFSLWWFTEKEIVSMYRDLIIEIGGEFKINNTDRILIHNLVASTENIDYNIRLLGNDYPYEKVLSMFIVIKMSYIDTINLFDPRMREFMLLFITSFINKQRDNLSRFINRDDIIQIKKIISEYCDNSNNNTKDVENKLYNLLKSFHKDIL